MAFKKGDTVIYKPCGRSRNASHNCPKSGEKITLDEPDDFWENSWTVKEYLKNKNGDWQCFGECCFRPIIHTSVGISKELAKSFTETLETSEVIKTQKEKAI